MAILSTASATEQPQILPGTIKGVVLNQTTHTPIDNANIIIIGTELGAAADLDGNFIIGNLKPGTYNIQATALGFQGYIISEVNVQPGKTTSLDFLLEPAVIKGDEVVVKGGYFRPNPNLVTSSRSLGYEEIRRAPGGAEDVQRVIQALPGVANSNDQNNEIIVRGGSPSENLLILDGIEIDNINHFPDQSTSGGPIGLVNPEFLKEVTFASGGFSARYGDRLSSVLDLDMRDGDREQFGGQLELSMAGVGANFEGGFGNRKGSYLASYRKSYLDLIHNAVGLTAVPHYWDSQFKVSYNLSSVNSISVLGLYGHDYISIEAEEEDAWTRGAEAVDASGHTIVLGTKWRKIWENGYSDLIIGRAELHFEHDVAEVVKDTITNTTIKRRFFLNTSTEITDQLHAVWTGKARDADEFSAGITLKPVTFSHDIWVEQDTVVYDDYNGNGLPDTVLTPEKNITESTTSFKYGGFVQYRWRPLPNLSVVNGVRVDGFQYSGEFVAGPRMSAEWEFAPRWTLKSAYGIYFQSHPLIIYNYDPAGGNKKLPHQRASQYILGLSRLFDRATIVSVEGYFKQYNNLTVSENDLRADDDYRPRSECHLAIGKKQAWGLEYFGQRKLATNWFGTLSYSYSRTEYDNSQQIYPAKYDYRNIMTLVIGYKFSGLPMREFQKRWYAKWTMFLPLNGDEMTLSSRFRYVSGRPFTPQEWTLDGPVYDYHWEEGKDLNSDRYPAYARWDVRLDNKWFFTGKSVVSFFEIENVLNRPNIAQYTYGDDGERDKVYQFGFFFVGGVRFEW